MNAPALVLPPLATEDSVPLHLLGLAELVGPPASQDLPAAAQAAEARWVHERQGVWRPGSLLHALQQPAAEDRRLVALAQHFGLTPIECLAVALASAVEREPMVGRVLAWLQAPAGGSRPTLGLCLTLAQIFGLDGALAALSCGVAREIGLLLVDDDRRPLPEQSVQVPLPIVLALQGGESRWPGLRRIEPTAQAVPSVRQVAATWARALSDQGGEGPSALVLRCGHPGDAQDAAAQVCASLGRGAVAVNGEAPRGLAPWLWLQQALPVFTFEAAPGESRPLPQLPGHLDPVLVACGVDGAVEHQGLPISTWRIPLPDAPERTALWQQHLPELPPEAIEELGRSHRHGAAHIRHLAQSARQLARLTATEGGSADPVHLVQSLHRAARRGAVSDLGSLAQLLPEEVGDDALVLPPELRQTLEALVQRCRHREHLADHLGPAARTRYHPGVRALLVGPSGTGKTLAASWLATRLGMPLYRVDLASMVSKYIGETEKNLAQLFARAEHAEVVLLFDEADSLFGKRTDVKDSNDRFANQQTNYLLQRIESFDGIAVLTSNSRGRFDSAFTRRLDVVVEFPNPGPSERRAVWLAHLGSGHDLDSGAVNRLAAGCELAGGHVRNVVLGAPGLAFGRPICEANLLPALAAEYGKLGKSMPTGLAHGSGAGQQHQRNLP